MVQRVFLDTDEMQVRLRIGGTLEQLPGAEEVQTRTEAGFADHQMLVALQRGEAPSQLVLRKKHVLGFGESAGAREIHVAVLARLRQAVLVPVEFGMLEGVGGRVIVHAGS